MRKTALSILLVIFLVTLVGCSSTKKPERTVNSKEDDIKFLGIEWLTEEKEVEKTIRNTYGKDYSKIVGKGEYLNTYCTYYWGKNGENDPLLWLIGDFDINYILLFYCSSDNAKAGTGYLYGASIDFFPSLSVYEGLYEKLSSKYTISEEEKNEIAGHVVFNDSNSNSIRLAYYSETYTDEPYLYIVYTCGDISRQLWNESQQVEEENQEEQQKKPSPDL